MPPHPAKAAAPPDPVVGQRILVYSLTALLCLTGLVLAIAFKDPCARAEGLSDAGLAQCHATLTGQLPDGPTYAAMAIVAVMLILMYELRWLVRVGAVAALGSLELVVAILIFHDNMSTVLGVANLLIGISLIGCSVGIQRNQRIAWAYAMSITMMSSIVFFFGSSRVRDATGWHLAWSVLPALAGFLPVAVALALTPPGATRYAPFAKKPLR